MVCPDAIGPVPEETARVAHAAFPKGHPYLRLADELGPVFTDEACTPLFPTHGQPALAPWRLALVTVLQFAEGLSDRQAADAVRSRIDWKYVLRLDLTDAGFDASVLSEFRSRLIDGAAEHLLFDMLLTWCRERQLLKARGWQRTDSTHVLAAVRALNRIQVVGETMRATLNSLAVVAPAWLRTITQPVWAERYARRAEDDRLPTSSAAREHCALTVGADGYALLTAVYAPSAPRWLREVPAINTLRHVWIQNYVRNDDQIQWRTGDDIPPAAQFISSPYDHDAHYARKHTTQWVGYKVHITETCDDDVPHIITHIETTAGPVADGVATPMIHAALHERDLVPRIHIVDTGFLDAKLLVDSQNEYGVDLVGPTRADYHWQARAGEGFDAQHFHIDWEHTHATCPEGCTSISWTPAVDKRHNDVIKIKFSTKDCGGCPSRARCIRSRTQSPRRTLTVRPQAQFMALQAARAREVKGTFRVEYARRAGIEGTISRGVRTNRLRRTRYIGQVRTHLGHVLAATGLNFLRLGEWFTDVPRAKSRVSPFTTLMRAVPVA